MEELIPLLDENLVCTSTDISTDFIRFSVISTRQVCICPSCQQASSRVHSRYSRNFQDLPIQDKKVVITLSNRKMFCDNASCHQTTFAETFSFLDNKAKKTKRLKETILEVSLTQSSVSAAAYLSQYVVDVKKSTICNYQKKSLVFINKESIEAICIDDFAMNKRKSYGTLMIDLTDGRVIDLIESREKKDVVIWLSLFPNIKFVSRDGSPTYAAAIREAHPEACHISDRFHLVKNLTDAITLYLYSVLSGRIIIPLTKEHHALNLLLTTKSSRRDKIPVGQSFGVPRTHLSRNSISNGMQFSNDSKIQENA